MMEILFNRIKTKSDIEQLKDWLKDPELLSLARMTDKPLTDEDYNQYIETLSYMIYVDGMAIGYARIYRYDDPAYGEIGIVIADPEYRNKGIGTKVGQKVIATCLAMGMTTIKWATATFNFASLRLANRLGFKFEQILNGVVSIKGETYDAIVLTLEVGNAI